MADNTHDNDNAHPLPGADVLAHVVDVHCHPTDSETPPAAMAALPVTICAMATRASDQPLVADLVRAWPDKVIPCFGYHPWFTHWIALSPPASKSQHYRTLLLPSADPDTDPATTAALDALLPTLPEPILLTDVLASLRADLTAFPNAMLGEVGLDRAFHIPASSPTEPRTLSSFTVPLAHQLAVLEAQLAIAVELRRNVSLHSVKAQQATLALVDRMAARHGAQWDGISIDMHSCGLSPEMWRALESRHPNIFLSLSTAINARSRNHRALIGACSPARLLAESDFHDVHAVAWRTWDMVCTIADVRGWPVERVWEPESSVREGEGREEWGAVRRLEANWRAFVAGGHGPARRALEERRRNRKDRKDMYWDVDESEPEGGLT